MARTHVIVRKPFVGVPSTTVQVAGLQTAPAVGALDRIASSRRVPTGLAITPAAGLAAGQSSTGATGLLLHVHSSGRYLATPANAPFFLVGDTAWSLALGLTEAEALTYMQTRAGQGFNTIFMDTVGLKGIVSGVSTDRNGNAPFNGTLAGGQYDVSTTPAAGDVSTTSAGRYWAHIDNLIAMAAGLGLQVVLDPFDTYCPWFSSDPANFVTDGHSPNSVAKLTAYGAFLGQRYAGKPNIQWVVGNDYLANATGNTNIAAVIDGIRQFDTVHTMSLEMNPPNNGDPVQAFGNATLRSRMNVNGLYEYNAGPYRADYLAAYNRGDFGPTMNLEAGYELNSGIGSTPATVRAGHYVMLLAGSCGDIYGNERVGGAGFGTNSGPWASDWVAQLTSQGGREMGYFAAFLASVAWSTLVPDQTGAVFVGVGTPADYGGARALDGTLAVAYKPATGGAAPSYTVNRDQMAQPFTARWFDPTAGTFTTIGTGITNSGQQVFTAPGNNSAGTNDWVLVLTAAAPSAFFSIPTQAQEQAFYDNVVQWPWTAGQKVPNFNASPAAAGMPTGPGVNVHDDTEGDDLWNHYQAWLRTGNPLYRTWAQAWRDYFVNGYLQDLQTGYRETTQAYPCHVYGQGLVLWGHMEGDAAALTAAANIGTFIAGHTVTPGVTQMSQFGARGRARWLIVACYLAQKLGTTAMINLRDNLIAAWLQSPDWTNGVLGSVSYNSRTQMGYTVSDSGGTPAYDAGRRMVSSFQLALVVEAFWRAYLATGRADVRARLEQLCWWMYYYGLDPAYVCPMVTADLGQEGNLARWHRDPDSGNANLSSGAAEYDTAFINGLVIGYKLTGYRPMFSRAMKHAENGQSWPAAAYNVARTLPLGSVRHFLDTLHNPDQIYFDYNKGEEQYAYLLHEGGGNPALIRSTEASAMQSQSLSMAVGEYRQLTGVGNSAAIVDTVVLPSPGVGSIITYADKLLYDPKTDRVYFQGSDDPGNGRRCVAYDLATNAWVLLEGFIDSTQRGVAHIYGAQCIDVMNRRLVRNNVGTVVGGVSYRNLDTGAITSGFENGITSNGGYDDAPAMENFPERNAYYYFTGNFVYERKHGASAWTVFSSTVNTSVHVMALYCSKARCIIFGGGNNTNTLYRLNLDGTITTLAAPPVGLQAPRVEMVENPATGEVFVYSSQGAGTQDFWRLNPTTGAWTHQGVAGIPVELFTVGPYTTQLIMVAGLVPKLGLQFYAACNSGAQPTYWMYRYA